MKIVKVDQELITVKRVKFEALEFSCMSNYHYLTFEKFDNNRCFATLFETQPYKNQQGLWEVLAAENVLVFAEIDLSDETPERVEFLISNVHKI